MTEDKNGSKDNFEDNNNSSNNTSPLDDYTVEDIVKSAMDTDADVEDSHEEDILDADPNGNSKTESEKSTNVDKNTVENEEEEKAKTPAALEDDEAWLAGDDLVVGNDDDSAFVKQKSGIINWRIEGMYNEKGKTHNQFYLKENPPLLIIESYNKDGEEEGVNLIILSKGLVNTLAPPMEDLRKAYYGVGRHRDEARTIDEKMRGIPEWAKDNPMKAVITTVLVVALIVLLFIV